MDRVTLHVALAQKQMRQWQLARRLGFNPSTFSEYVRGVRQAPEGLVRRIERELQLREGQLSI